MINPEKWKKCVEFHGHECGGLTIGYKAAEYATKLLDIKFSNNEDVVCIAASPHGSLIGGVTADGQLLLAGLAVDGQDMCRKFGKMAPKLLEG